MFEEVIGQLEKYEGLRYLQEEIITCKEKFINLYKYGMVLLGPDSFIQGEALDIVRFFEKNGFKLLKVKFRKLQKTQVENLFLPTSSCVKCGDLKWWMIQESANKGVFCGALFYCEDGTEKENCLQLLNNFKGKSDPMLNQSGVVRYDFAAINICLNLIHIPDTYGDFFKDSSPFYSIQELANITQLKEEQGMDEDYKFEIKLHENTSKYLFETLFYKIMYYLACLLKYDDGQLRKRYYNQYNAIQKLESRKERYLLVKKSMVEEVEILSKAEDTVFRLFKNIADKRDLYSLIEEIDILRLLKLFSNPLEFKQYNKDIFTELELYGIVCDDYEKLILNTSLIQWT